MKKFSFIGMGPLRKGRTTLAKAAQRGVAAVEFALVLPAFLLFIIGTTELSMLLLTQHLLENATFNASRTAKTGYIATGKTQIETVMDVLMTRLSGLSPLIDPAKVSVSWVSYGSLSQIGQPEQGEPNLGTADQVVVYTISYPWQMFTPLIGHIMGDENNIVTLTSRIVVRNEPYD